MTTSLEVTVYGIPKPQGSKRAFVVKGKDGGNSRAVVVDDNKATLRTWRDDVKAATLDAMPYDWQRIDKPRAVFVVLAFGFDRPASHYGSGRNAAILKASAPAFHTTKPDVDKLTRGILDALTSAGVYADDSQVIRLDVLKVYVPRNERPGVGIIIREEYADPRAHDSAVPPIGEALDGTAEPTDEDPLF